MPQGSKSSAVVYQPTILRSMTELCKAFGVGPRTVKGWVEKGAPIAVEGEGANTRYSAEMVRLQAWRASRSKASNDVKTFEERTCG